MFPLFLLAVASAIVLVMLLFLGWRQMDRRIKMAYTDEQQEDLKALLAQALEHQKHLTSRVEHLETIIAGEPWSLSRQPPLALPDDESDAPPEQSAEHAGRRQHHR